MSSEDNRDLEVMKLNKGSEERLYHFLIVIALGVLSFSLERFSGPRDQSWFFVLQLAWLSLLTSAIAGIAQVQWRLAVTEHQRKIAAKKADASRYHDALAGRAGVFDAETQKVLTPGELKSDLAKYNAGISKMESDFLKREGHIYIMTAGQVYGLYFGLLLLGVFKIFLAK